MAGREGSGDTDVGEDPDAMDEERKAIMYARRASYGKCYVCYKDVDRDGDKDILIGIIQVAGRYRKDALMERLEEGIFRNVENVHIELKLDYKDMLRTGKLEG